jgi:hypothetical protein
MQASLGALAACPAAARVTRAAPTLAFTRGVGAVGGGVRGGLRLARGRVTVRTATVSRSGGEGASKGARGSGSVGDDAPRRETHDPRHPV